MTPVERSSAGSHLFTLAVQDSIGTSNAYDLVFGLFREMNTPGKTPAGRYAGTPYFDGGLFETVQPFSLTGEELERLIAASHFDWSAVEPVIFGTLFEQSLDKGERHAFGAHFTSEADIQRIVQPTIVRPWQERIDGATTLAELAAVERDLHQFRVLDPACGCGNFLYVAFRELRRIEHDLFTKVAERQRSRQDEIRLSLLATSQFYGLDIRPFAIEIAKVTLLLAKKLSADEFGDVGSVLPLDNLDNNFIAGDALAVDWPAFDVCVGNPPYLGRRRLIEERGASYATWLSEAFPDVRGVSDYVAYWFRLTHDRMRDGQRAGLVGTNSIREGDTRKASLDYIVDNGGRIVEAVSTLPWSGEAQVNVSIVNWIKGSPTGPAVLWLDGGESRLEVDQIDSHLSTRPDLRSAAVIQANRETKRCFQGQTPGHVGGFVLTPEEAVTIIAHDPSSRTVIHPFFTGDELNSSGQPERFIIDFPHSDAASAKASAPGTFRRVEQLVLPDRRAKASKQEEANRTILARSPDAKVNLHHIRFLDRWWQLSYRRAEMLDAIRPLTRYIALSRYAIEDRPSIYAFVDTRIRPSDKIQVFAFDDDYSFGILQSSLHRAWFEARCTTLGRALSYTSKTVFDTFPWPQSPTKESVEEVGRAVGELLAVRDDRLQRGISLGEQYDALRLPGNDPLRRAHESLDMAVLRAYDFDSTSDPLLSLLALNQSIARSEADGLPVVTPRAPASYWVAPLTDPDCGSIRVKSLRLRGTRSSQSARSSFRKQRTGIRFFFRRERTALRSRVGWALVGVACRMSSRRSPLPPPSRVARQIVGSRLGQSARGTWISKVRRCARTGR